MDAAALEEESMSMALESCCCSVSDKETPPFISVSVMAKKVFEESYWQQCEVRAHGTLHVYLKLFFGGETKPK